MGILVNDVLKQLIKPVGELPKTVDTLKFGTTNMDVSGIAVTFMPTYDVLKQANRLGANLLITHEGIFHSHWDDSDIGPTKVSEDKLALIKESGMAIFRFHDYIHKYTPDGIMQGLIQSLQWEEFVDEHQPTASILTVPGMTVKDVCDYVKNKLGMEYLRVVGDPSMPCEKIGLLAGFRGGGSVAIPLFEQQNLDLVIYGEGPEWETPEYVRDAIQQGKHKALIVLGHMESEAAGMQLIATELATTFPSTPVHFIPVEPTFKVM
ncbi:Nif3-like dinuclear metal center hexameric protein [Aquibacillus koreensis]|uniref:GTP cyclohydrolase 1 type 2 homolog n=1 Tax=Aquibacillus koreensis TaxID=279446 RepID=A0A9X3WLE7_9BACI|nr:Nif3-like dinuclear metal center hexameric protein [Aquibacillus koreensis]MCT2537665.1 Nif3-like dinuclear metal center hexameric protein [Aquibacillus koreensis]MDC3420988.1 Nif3-like dinuclear metal center hexameric protein [Aquibacillus koreensis]